MSSQTITVDEAGRIKLPQQVLDALGVQPDQEIILEWTERGIILKPKQSLTPITDQIAAMDLPVSDWNGMEREIEAGRQH